MIGLCRRACGSTGKGWKGALETGILSPSGKGRRRWLIPLALAALMTAALVLRLAAGRQALRQSDETLVQAAQDLDHYDASLVLHPETRELAISLRIRHRNREDRPYADLLLRTWAGAYELAETSPAAQGEFYAQYYPDGFSAGGILLHDLLWQGEPVPHAFEDEARTMLRLSIPELAPGEAGELELRCVVRLPRSPGRLGVYGEAWRLGNVLPVLAPREDGRWMAQQDWPIGDPYVSEAANYRVRLSLPEGYQALSSAPLDSEALALRDFALVVTRGAANREQLVDGTRLIVRAQEDRDARQLMGMAVKAFRFLSGRYGPYPWPTLSLAEVTFPLGGVEHSGLTLVSDAYLRQGQADAVELVVVHELAHQWFHALVGSDQARQPWQDEALCDWAVLSYVRAHYGQAAFESVKASRVDVPMRQRLSAGATAGSPIYDFLTIDDYASLVYARGAALMEAIELNSGRADAFLRHYVERFRHQLVTREDFESALNGFLGRDLSPLVADYLDRN